MKKESKTIIAIDKSLEYHTVIIPPEKQIPLHSQPTWELSCIITGEGTRLLSDISEQFEAGETVLIPPGIPHCWYFNKDKTDADGNIENITMFFSTDFLHNVSSSIPELAEHVSQLSSLRNATVFEGEARSKIYSLLLRMRDESREKRILTFLEIMLEMSAGNSGRKIDSSKQRTRSEVRMSQVKSYVNCNYAREISVDEIASHVGMNKSSFCTFIKKETGLTFTNYLNDLRLSLAVNMLGETDMRVSEIASAVGIPDIPYFCRIFKKRYALTPSEFRINGVSQVYL